MSLKPTEFSRRAFLGGLGATVAAAVAHASTEPFLHLHPLEVAAFVDGPDGVAALIYVLQSTTIDLQTVLTSSTILRKEVDRLVTSKGRAVAVFNASARRRDRNQLPSALLVLGRWESRGEKLLPLSLADKSIYIDDPLLAKRLAKTIGLPSSPKSS